MQSQYVERAPTCHDPPAVPFQHRKTTRKSAPKPGTPEEARHQAQQHKKLAQVLYPLHSSLPHPLPCALCVRSLGFCTSCIASACSVLRCMCLLFYKRLLKPSNSCTLVADLMHVYAHSKPSARGVQELTQPPAHSPRSAHCVASAQSLRLEAAQSHLHGPMNRIGGLCTSTAKFDDSCQTSRCSAS